MSRASTLLSSLLLLQVVLAGCRKPGTPAVSEAGTSNSAQEYFHVDPAKSGTIRGVLRYAGPLPVSKRIDMSNDPACVQAHQGKAFDESLVVGPHHELGNAFIYIAAGLEGKRFPVPSAPVTIDQRGCWFRPRVLGVQTNQVLQIVNSDPVTHNIHPMAQVNREWNHSQAPGDAPVDRHFTKSEIMIPVKCNIHSWMHAYIGVLDHPYFTVSRDDGTFTIPELPAGQYVLKVWQEKLGTLSVPVSVTAGKSSELRLSYPAP